MYTCEICDKSSQDGAKLLRHIVRAPIHPKGYKIVQELKCCYGCKAQLDAGQPYALLRQKLQPVVVNEEPKPLTPVEAPPVVPLEPICFQPVMLLGKKVTAQKK